MSCNSTDRSVRGRTLRRLVGSTALAAYVVLGSIGLIACGKTGDPLPPIRIVPAKTTDLAVVQRGNELLIEFGFPTTTVAGTPLPGIDSLTVLRSAVPVRSETELPAADRRLFGLSAEPWTELTGVDLTEAIQGDRIRLRLPVPEAPESGALAVTLGVRTRALGGEVSDISDLVTFSPQDPPNAPRDLVLEGRADGVRIAWSFEAPEPIVVTQPPAEDGSEPEPETEEESTGGDAESTTAVAEPEDSDEAPAVATRPAFAGFNLYRRDASARQYGAPVKTLPPRAREYVDAEARFGRSYIYAVTAVKARRPIVAESAPAQEAAIDYRDRFAPDTPQGVVALPETGRVRLVWSEVRTDDLAGYHVYRRAATSDGLERLTDDPITQSEFTDANVTPGSYFYSVTAVDDSSNESEHSAESEARVR